MKKIMSMLLAVMTVISLFAVSSFAAEGKDYNLRVLTFEEHLQARPRPHCVVRNRRDDATRIRVVLHLVPSAGAEDLPSLRIGLRVSREELGGGPVPRVVLGGLRRVEAGANPPWEREPGTDRGVLSPKQVQHTAPPDAILVTLRGHRRPCVARFEAK